MRESFNVKVEDALKKEKGPVGLDRIYKAVASDPGMEEDPEFKRKVRRALYHLGKAGKASRIGPSTYKQA
ncbi:MAG: hypothetical protein MPJ08_05385 [Nitrosopumilus sp.]|nr:hypothetical protein [Nitrosopumilus sp.]